MVAYSPDGTKIATAEGRDGARAWDAAEQGKRLPKAILKELYVLQAPIKILEAPRQGEQQTVLLAEFSADGKRLITTQANGRVKVWNASSWAVEDEITVSSNAVGATAISADSKTLVFGDTKGVLHEWRFEN